MALEVFNKYGLAREHAQAWANRLVRPMGIELANEYGRKVYRVAMLPIKRSQRFGWELRCEVVNPQVQQADGSTREYGEWEYPPSNG